MPRKRQQRVRWGVIGATGIAQRRTIPEGILQASNSVLQAVQSRDEGRARAVADRFHAPRWYTRAEDLAADPEVDAVYIATPTGFHAEQTLLCARAGKAVFCEKPMARNVAECQAMICACEAARVALGLAFMMRFHAGHAWIREQVLAGRLGMPITARAQFAFWYPPMAGAWRQDPIHGGGALPDVGAHGVDLLTWFLGPVRSVSAQISTRAHAYAVDDTSVLLLDLASGAMGVVEACFSVLDAASRNCLELYGTHGAIRAEETLGQGDGGTILSLFQEDEGHPAYRRLRYRRRNTYAGEIADFADAVRSGRAPRIPGREGLHNQAVLDAAYRSAAEGRRIEIAEVLSRL